MTLGTLGVTSILLTVAGYWAGRYGETTGRGRAYAPSLTAFVGHHRSSPSAGRRSTSCSASRSPSGEVLRASSPRRCWPRVLVLPVHAGLPRRARQRRSGRPRASGRSRLSSPPYGERRSPSRRFLPPEPGVEAPHRLTPGLALRVGVLGAVAIAVFAVLFVRLWSLQVLSGDQYLAAAQDNQLRTIQVEAPRGHDRRPQRQGASSTTCRAPPSSCGSATSRSEGRYDVIQRARRRARRPGRAPREGGRRAAVRPAQPDHREDGGRRGAGRVPLRAPGRVPRRADPADVPAPLPVRVARGADPRVRRRDLAGGARRGSRKEGYRAGDKVGKVGIEASYDPYLRGEPGEAQIRVDSLGRPQSALELRTRGAARQRRAAHDRRRASSAPPSGRSATGSRRARANESYYANGGAIVALDPRDGAVLAMASYPTYKPSRLRRPRRPEEDRAARERGGRAGGELPGSQPRDAGRVPAGLDLEAGHRARRDAGAHARAVRVDPVHADRDVRARQVRVPQLGSVREQADDARARRSRGRATRTSTTSATASTSPATTGARGCRSGRGRFGFGAPTGFDLGAEAVGLVPTPAWRKQTFTSDWDRAWNPGDSIQLSIGQKEVRVTPLQMARFYAMIANGGKLVTPYVVQSVETPGANGQSSVVAAALRARAAALGGRRPGRAPGRPRRALLGDALVVRHLVGVFGTYPIPIAGKTGHGGEGRPAPGLPGRAPRGPVLVVRLRPVRRRGAHRRLRRDRERRPRVDGGRAGSARGSSSGSSA